MRTSEPKSRIALAIATIATTATLVLVPGLAANASTYQDHYDYKCGAGVWRITSNTTGNVLHYRNHAVTAYWNGGSIRITRISAPLSAHSGSQSSTQTAGAHKWVYSASATCV